MKAYRKTPLFLEDAPRPRGLVHIIPERCKGCMLCVEFCPRGVLQVASAMNAKGYHYPEIVDGKEDACIHCEFCTMVCPEFAIYTTEVSS